uniref:Major capsid protein n=1 Tax=Dulem virus 208 TaxID=3145685 RepID=A0AAU8BBK9_9VIRU
MEAIRNNVNFSNFDLSHVHKTSMDMGQLVPIACIPTLPGDKFNVDVDAFIRGMPTIAPIMDKVDIKINHFYVPYRVLWSRFEEFISHSDKHKLRNQPKPTMPVIDTHSIGRAVSRLVEEEERANGSSSSASIKAMSKLLKKTSEKYKIGKLSNYLGVDSVIRLTDVKKESTYQDLISLMPVLAYNRIFLDYYAPQRWVSYFEKSTSNHWFLKLSVLMEAIKNSNNYVLKGDILNAYSSEAVIDLRGFYGLTSVSYNEFRFYDPVLSLLSLKHSYWNQDYFNSALPEPTLFGDIKLPVVGMELKDDEKYFNVAGDKLRLEQLTANTADAKVEHNKNVLGTIRDLRKAVSLQHYYETLSQSGGRYLETMEVMFGKRLPDDMLNYSQYLGGSVIPLFVNEVEQTSPYESKSGQKSYLGDLSGKPVGAGNTENIFFEADEYGIYMCIAHIVPKRSYFGVGSRFWRELDALDLPNPAFEGLGDQAVYRYELGDTSDVQANEIFGYVPRYAHYKTQLDRFSGEMVHSLKHWHLGDYSYSLNAGLFNFGVSPEGFACIPRNDIFQVSDEPDKFICTYNLRIDAVRPLSYQSPVGVNRI